MYEEKTSIEGSLFGNVGGKIKTYALVLVILEVIASVFWAIYLFGEEEGLLGFLILILCPLAVWLTNLFTYGFGEIIESLQLANQQRAEMLRLMRKDNNETRYNETMPEI